MQGTRGGQWLRVEDSGEFDDIEAQLDETGLGRLSGKQGKLGLDVLIVSVLVQQRQVAVIVTGAEEDLATGRDLKHEFEHFSALVISLVFAIPDVDEGEEAINTAETRGELPQVGPARQDTPGGKGFGQPVHIGVEVDDYIPVLDIEFGMPLA